MNLSIKAHLAAPDGAASVLEHARHVLCLDRDFKSLLPPMLHPACHVANFRSGTLIIHAGNSSIAARLRQMTPRICRHFAALGLSCHAVEIRLQPGGGMLNDGTVSSRSPGRERVISVRTESCLRDTAARMPANDPLRQALEHLLQRARITDTPVGTGPTDTTRQSTQQHPKGFTQDKFLQRKWPPD